MDINKVTTAMIDYYQGQPKRIQHFLKVHAYAKLIGEQEGLDKEILDILEVAALTHDIGIKISEEKYNSSAVKLLSHFCDFYTLSYSSTLGKLFFQKILFISQIPVFVLKILPFTDSIVSLELCSSARFTKKSASTRI